MAWLPLLVGFAITIGFISAKPISTLKEQGTILPSNWEAAVANHGNYIEWYLISSHPIAFSLGLILFLLPAVALFPIGKAIVWQNKNAAGTSVIVHKIAQFVVTALIFGIGYFAVTQLLVGVAPA